MAESLELAREHAGSHSWHGRIGTVAAATFAALAAIANMLSNQLAMQAFTLKNQAVFVRNEASDSYNFYESKSIKEHIYEASLAVTPNLAPGVRGRLTAVAAGERSAAAPILRTARTQEANAREESERSERLVHAHEVMEGGVALLEISIAVVSISVLSMSTFLLWFAGGAAAAGAAVVLYGLTLR